ncbi:rhomboid family intramembrane serine protease [Paenibacillus glycanilyticus]|uniref:Peptidase S54 rhomboid domain-containing protein n=1 Tax=Paenibacillus glycanilyticus TaxID=126569 RepID=A0ABQ6GEW2_9BACL|nr:rhomboid family intramembrane serine protease [Paenibacillus glycanilyticus]GLX67582.1 hypothetical protein MU1_19270 [Paenibacillus glycanilyticus]
MKKFSLAFPVTVAVIAITSIFTLLQFIYPEVLSAFRRNPAALESGEWWRIFTPLLVHSDGFGQYIFNMACLAFLGASVEKNFGWRLLVVLYAISGVAGEIAGYASWDPNGAGASVGFCGLLGGLVVCILKRKADVNPLVRKMSIFIVLGMISGAIGGMAIIAALYGGVILLFIIVQRSKGSERLLDLIGSWGTLLGALVLLGLHDIHGVSILVGSMLALAVLPLLKRASTPCRPTEKGI